METGALHSGCKDSCKAYLGSVGMSYVYILRRPSCGNAFYVGKGGGGSNKYRAFDHENEARHPNNRRSNAYKLNVIRSLWRANEQVVYEIDSLHEHELAALEREAYLIRTLKRLHEGGRLTNLSPGGGNESGASPLSRERHATTLGGIPEDNPERATVSGFVLSIHPASAKRLGSIPVKPLSQHIPKPTQLFPHKKGGATIRQAVALAASAAAHGISLHTACEIPRLLKVEDVDAIIESGVACRIVTTGMAIVIPDSDPRRERFALTAIQARQVAALVGTQKCQDLGILDLAQA